MPDIKTARTSSVAACVVGKPPGSKQAESHLWYATLTVTIASGVMSTIGVYEVLAENRAYGLYLSLLIGIVITAMLSGAWNYLFFAFPRSQGRTRVGLTLLLLPFLGLVFLISTWTNATAVVGGPALNMHNRVFLEEYERALEKVRRKVDASERTVAAIRNEAVVFRSQVDAEIAEGRLTGFAGSGVVAATLAQIADKLDGLVKESEAAGDKMAQVNEAASAAFTELQSHLETGRNDGAFVKEHLEKIRKAVIRMDEQSPAAVVAAMLPAIRDGISLPDPTGRTGALRERQAEALNKSVRPSVEKTFAALDKLARGTAAESVRLPEFTHLTAAEAAMYYMNQFPIYWAMAVAIDAMPLMFLFLVTATAVRGNPNFDLTANELYQAMTVFADLRTLVEGCDNVTLLPQNSRRVGT